MMAELVGKNASDPFIIKRWEAWYLIGRAVRYSVESLERWLRQSWRRSTSDKGK